MTGALTNWPTVVKTLKGECDTDGYDLPMRLTPTGYVPHSQDQISLEIIINQTEIALRNEEDKDKLKEPLNHDPSLGGARPKYSVNLAGTSYLAKYSISQDTRREPLIEFATMSMAQALGLNVPEIKIGKATNRDVFYIKRFDRNGSYPFFIEALIKVCKDEKQVKSDLKELFRRIAFNIAVNNDDDHPRNHGVLYTNNAWGLSPLYDVVPKDSQTQSFRLAMEVGIQKREASKTNILSVCEYFRLEKAEAETLVDEIFMFVKTNWQTYFRNAGLNEDEIQRFANAMSIKN